ncbi:hypothetical protein [Streptomyces sp. NPDC005283]|uniref:hypothetical protein n=1 Tax=Streptomyces sp. NPDC005283 TaxID=3156871 RepID=UPI0034555600
MSLTIASGCSDAAPHGGQSSSTASASSRPHPSSTQSGGRAERVEGESVTKAPKPVGDGKVLLSADSRKGNAVLPLDDKIDAGALAIQVNCQGKGTLTVSVDPIGLSFPLECIDHEVSSTYNEINLKRARSEGSVRITAPSMVRWALTVEKSSSTGQSS